MGDRVDNKLPKRMKKFLRKTVRIAQKKHESLIIINNRLNKLNNRQLVSKAIDGEKLCIDKNFDKILKNIAKAIEAIDTIK